MGLQAMLQEGVGIFEALGTGQAAYYSVVLWFHKSKRKKKSGLWKQNRRDVTAWLENRELKDGRKSMEILEAFLGSSACGAKAQGIK